MPEVLRTQVSAPQQPVPVPLVVGVHAEPAPAQQVRPEVPATQRSPVQQSSVVVQPLAPAGRHVAVVRQVPSVQRDPSQQSLSSLHDSPSARQAQRPSSSQSIVPQHSSEVAQVAPCRWQQRLVTGVGRQSKPPQHCEARVQVLPGAVHIAQVPLEQLSGALHDPPEQQAWPDAPQVAAGIAQRPEVHTSGLEQELPGQHASPEAPQRAGCRHTPAVHSVPRSHARPLQQGWPAAPQAAGMRQLPSVHWSPVPHWPSQQGPSAWPQATHMPPSQVPPLAQRSPVQQRWPTVPHSLPRSQRPSRQRPPAQQSEEVSQSPPVSTQQRPALQP